MRSSVDGALGPMELQKVETPVLTALKSLESFRQLVGRSLGRIGWSQKRAALEIGIPESQFSRQLAGTEHLSLWRMFALPREFWAELVLLIIEFYDLPIGNLSEADKRDLVFGREMRETLERRLAR